MGSTAARQAPYPVRANHKRCAKCGKMVARATFQCRRCGKRLRMRPKTLLLLSSVALMVVIYAIALGGDVLKPQRLAETAWTMPKQPVATTAQTERAATEAAANTAANAAQASHVSAADLWMAYARDPAGADRRFRDRPVLVNGIVRSIDRDFDGRVMVRLTTGDTLETVNAKLATSADGRTLTGSKGKAISLLCVGRGALIGAPLLGGCSVYSG